MAEADRARLAAAGQRRLAGEQTDQVVAALLELLAPDPASPNLDVYGMFWVLEALGRTGHIEEAIGNVLGHDPDFYRKVMDDLENMKKVFFKHFDAWLAMLENYKVPASRPAKEEE